MKILMDLDQETLQKYTMRSGITFNTIQPTEQAVVVLLPDSPKLEEVFNMNMPTAVIAGDINDSIKEIAQNIGYPGEAIIVKDSNTFRTLTGTPLFEGQNIPLSKLVAIANFVYENDIRPEIIVWSPSFKPAQEVVSQPNIQPKEIIKPVVQEVVYKEQPIRVGSPTVKPVITNLPISDIAERARLNIYLLKTVADADSCDIAYAINQKLGGLHIDITGRPVNAHYGHDKESALSTQQYGYSPDGINVELANTQVNTVVYEIDADYLDSSLLQKLYDKSHHVYQIPSSFARSIDSIQSWISAQFRLDGIIATQDFSEFKQEWPNLVFTLDQVLQQL